METLKNTDFHEKTIMLGNGINRCIASNISGENILSTIAKKYNVEQNINISFPMQFETIVNQILYNQKNITDDIYITIKQEIIELLEEINLSPDAPHSALVSSADSIITTNYDHLIERSIDNQFSAAHHTISNVNKYNLNNYIEVAGKKVFHVHGDLRSAKSICLGYEHYAGTVQNLRREIVSKANNIPKIMATLNNEIDACNIWAKKFFTDNIHIVGLGLTKAEIDIWWLITYRASLLYSNSFDFQSMRNEITYHDIGVKANSDMKYLLENLGVNYKFYKISKDDSKYYLEKYVEIANLIKQ